MTVASTRREYMALQYGVPAAALLLAAAFCMMPALGAAPAELREQARQTFAAISAPATEELQNPLVQLGRMLFWDPRLSLDGRTACASCHLAPQGGADARPQSPTARGGLTRFNSMSVFNAQDASAGLRWLADRASGAEQAIGSLTGSLGFAAPGDVLPLLERHGYAARFDAAYPDTSPALSVANYGAALEAYQRTLRTPSAFDAWLAGDAAALDATQLEGLQHFLELGCAGCHNGALLGGSSLQRFGVFGDYWEWTASARQDTGLMAASGDAADRNRFRVQPLRNVALTAPYFHDGSVANLQDAVAIMAKAQLGRELSATTLAALVAFLESLSGPVPAHYSAPAGLPAPSTKAEPAP